MTQSTSASLSPSSSPPQVLRNQVLPQVLRNQVLPQALHNQVHFAPSNTVLCN